MSSHLFDVPDASPVCSCTRSAIQNACRKPGSPAATVFMARHRYTTDQYLPDFFQELARPYHRPSEVSLRPGPRPYLKGRNNLKCDQGHEINGA
jgi:hypothetical protein